MSFAAPKNQSNLNTLLDEFQKQSSPETKSFDDDRFWKPEMDKSGNGFAVIRFSFSRRRRDSLGKDVLSFISRTVRVGSLKTH